MSNMKEIAKVANVSKSTVSNVLQKRGNVSKKLQKKVKYVAKELNAENKKVINDETNKSKIVSFFFNMDKHDVHSDFEKNLLNGILSICNKHDYFLLVSTNNSLNLSDSNLHIGGSILLNPENNSDHNRGNIPYVWIGTPPLSERGKIPYVDNDNELIGYTVTEYLITNNHRNIVYINSPAEKTVSESRKQGFEKAIDLSKKVKPKFQHFYTESKQNYFDQTYEIASHLLSERIYKPDAFIVNSEMMAKAIYKVCEEKDLRIPDDVSVIAIYAEDKACEIFEPKLTSINLNEYQLGEEAGKLLLSIIGYEKTSGGGSIVPTNIIPRGSVKNNKGDSNVILRI